MQNHQPYYKTDFAGWQKCFCCGIQFRLLGIPFGSTQISVRSLAQRRVYQCANCGHMACCDCSLTDVRCICGTNAWIARSVFMRKQHKQVRYLTINGEANPTDHGLSRNISKSV